MLRLASKTMASCFHANVQTPSEKIALTREAPGLHIMHAAWHVFSCATQRGGRVGGRILYDDTITINQAAAKATSR